MSENPAEDGGSQGGKGNGHLRHLSRCSACWSWLPLRVELQVHVQNSTAYLYTHRPSSPKPSFCRRNPSFCAASRIDLFVKPPALPMSNNSTAEIGSPSSILSRSH